MQTKTHWWRTRRARPGHRGSVYGLSSWPSAFRSAWPSPQLVSAGQSPAMPPAARSTTSVRQAECREHPEQHSEAARRSPEEAGWPARSTNDTATPPAMVAVQAAAAIIAEHLQSRCRGRRGYARVKGNDHLVDVESTTNTAEGRARGALSRCGSGGRVTARRSTHQRQAGADGMPDEVKQKNAKGSMIKCENG